jgi:hypothetical protein
VPAAQGRLRDINYADMQQVSRKFAPDADYIIFRVTIAILPHLVLLETGGWTVEKGP